MTDALAAFERARTKLFGIAYRMLGTTAEAEDVLQDVWVRWQGVDHATVTDPTAFLATTTTRLSLNVAQSAHVKRASYVGPWLPEPIDTSDDPLLGAERGEALEFAVLVLLEKLSPPERAAYVLREAFDYEYADIAGILELSEANARQIVSRARKHLADERRAPVNAAEQRRLLEVFIDAARRGDRASLEELLTTGVVSRTDGNGAARAARIPVVGRERVAQFISSFATHFWVDTQLTWLETNGRTSVLVSRGAELVALASIDASRDGIENIFWVMSPAKLRAFEAHG